MIIFMINIIIISIDDYARTILSQDNFAKATALWINLLNEIETFSLCQAHKYTLLSSATQYSRS